MGLKTELLEYGQDIINDYDKEEIDNWFEILEEIEEEDLSDMSYLSQKLLLRLINDDELYKKVTDAKEELYLDFTDPFE
jgi:hypothetical protein